MEKLWRFLAAAAWIAASRRVGWVVGFNMVVETMALGTGLLANTFGNMVL